MFKLSVNVVFKKCSGFIFTKKAKSCTLESDWCTRPETDEDRYVQKGHTILV